MIFFLERTELINQNVVLFVVFSHIWLSLCLQFYHIIKLIYTHMQAVNVPFEDFYILKFFFNYFIRWFLDISAHCFMMLLISEAHASVSLD